jgi:hypothetical protein
LILEHVSVDRFVSFVTRGLDPRVHPFRKKMDCRVIRAFTPVFAGYARQ